MSIFNGTSSQIESTKNKLQEFSGNLKDLSSNGYMTPTALLNALYPIGSVYITSTNSNPANTLGGSWTLVDKEFKSVKHSEADTGDRFTKTTDVSSYDLYMIYGGHTIRLRLGFKLTAGYNKDDVVNVGDLILSNIGVSGLYHSILSIPAMGDAGNGLLMGNISNSGTVYINDVVKASTAGGSLYINEEITLKKDEMLDSFCDKFYWKRTS